jgi:hypothetical protein
MKTPRVLAAALLLAGGAALFAAAPAYAADLVPTDPPEGASDQICEGLDSGKSPDGAYGTDEEIFAPEGQVITLVCVKAGDEASGAGVEYYEVVPPSESVVISHSTGKDISHFSFSYEPATPPTTPPATTPPVTTPPVETTPPAETTTPPTTTTPAPAGGGDGDALAETGFDGGWLLVVGLAALGLGGAIVGERIVAARRH